MRNRVAPPPPSCPPDQLLSLILHFHVTLSLTMLEAELKVSFSGTLNFST